MNASLTDSAQPPRNPADSAGMTIDQAADLEAFYATLWIGALLVATNAIADPFPSEFGQLAAMYFELFPPVAKA